MNVPTALEFDKDAMTKFKAVVGRAPSRLNIKVWVAKLVSDALDAKIEVRLSEKQRSKLIHDAKKDVRKRLEKSDPPRSVSVVKGTVPTILQRHNDPPKSKKFTLRKK